MRPSVLIVDPDDDRRRGVGQGLAQSGYEVVPTGSLDEGRRFARGLGPSVIVGPAELDGFDDGALLDAFSVQDPSTIRRTLVVLGHGDDLDRQRPADVLFLPVDGLGIDQIQRRIRLVLVGREIGVDPDLEMRYLIGDSGQLPLIDLTRALGRCLVTGTVDYGEGWVAFDRGRPFAARLGTAEGEKAYCRLARRLGVPFRLRLGIHETESNLTLPTDDLLLLALEEQHLDLPDPQVRIRVAALHDIPSGEMTPHEKMLARAIHNLDTVGEALDRIPAVDSLIVQALRKMLERGALIAEKPKASVRVITDSTSDLPAFLARAHDILIVPLTVHFGKESFRDGVDIKARDFYRMLQDLDDHPRTQPPDEDVFLAHYHEVIAEQDILSIHISSKLSETSDHARKAALRGMRTFDHLPESRRSFALEIVDARSVSVGIGLQALFASRMAARGEKLISIVRRLDGLAERTHLLFAVDSLDSLVRGGRIGKARALAGKLLSIKPILGVVDGEVAAVDRARGGKRVHPRIVQLLEERVDPKRGLVVAVGHAQAPVWADRLAKLLRQRFSILELISTDIGPVVGTHAGPGTVGVVAFQPTDEEWQLFAPLEA
ncbi:MAG: DegV family protein [Acidobacteriota bacterium]